MPDSLRLIIVSGLSGSGKSIALHILEDLNYYCIDNLPAALLEAAVENVRSGDEPINMLAFGVDARTRKADLLALPQLLQNLKKQNIETELIFLHASDEILKKRYSESRRRHPLATAKTELQVAIEAERDILAEIQNSADLIIDTSHSSIYELAEVIRDRIDRRKSESLSVLVQSFGFKYGIPADADFVFDLRSLPNPYWTADLRGLTGLDKEVSDYLNSKDNFVAMHKDILTFLRRWIPNYQEARRSYLTVAIGCTGGQHRSVCMTEMLVASLRETHEPVLIRHNSLTGQRLNPD